MDKQEKLKRVAEIMAELESLDVNVKLDNSNKTNAKVVGEGINRRVVDDTGMVIEIANCGKGFAIYSDTSKLDKEKFKRLTR